MDALSWLLQVSTVVVFLLCAHAFIRSWPDLRRSWLLRRRQPSTVRRQLGRALRSGEPMPTPELARGLVDYAAVWRRQIELTRRAPMTWSFRLMALNGAVLTWQGVQWQDRMAIVFGLLFASYPLGLTAYFWHMKRRITRAEQANADLAPLPEPCFTEPACVDTICI